MGRSGLLLLALTPASAAVPTLTNADFEMVAGGAPAGWRIIDTEPADGFALGTAPGEHGRAARFASTTARPGRGGGFGQTVNATPWRGKLVEVSARVRTETPVRAGLMMVVHRPEPNATGFRDYGSADLATTEWRRLRVVGHVDDDALTIDVGASLAGRGAVLIDDVAVAEATLPTTPPSAAASAYLDAALERMKGHYRARHLDWPAIEARARREIAGARTPRDTWWAIRGVLGTLGDHHSNLNTRNATGGQVAGGTTSAPAYVAPPAAMPTTRLVAGRFGLVALPALNTFGPGGEADGVRYAATARAGLARLDRATLCGWIVDLRDNEGGNMWPMLNGVGALLGGSSYGAFVTPEGEKARWVKGRTGVLIDGTEGEGGWPLYAPFGLRQSGKPLAVLTSDRTASSGEAVAIAFSGRPGARRFGKATAGYTTANEAKALSDGAVLAVAVSWEQDRTGRDFRDKVPPDVPTTVAGALPAAQRWLARQCVSRPTGRRR